MPKFYVLYDERVINENPENIRAIPLDTAESLEEIYQANRIRKIPGVWVEYDRLDSNDLINPIIRLDIMSKV